MDDKQDMEIGEETTESAGAGQAPELKETTPQSSPLAETIAQRLNELETKLKEADKRWQGDKDRRIPALESDVKDLRAFMDGVERLEKSGFSREDAIDFQRMRQSQERPQPQTQTVPQPKGEGQAIADAMSELTKHGIDPNDPDFLSLVRAFDENFPIKVDKFIATKLYGRIKGQQAPEDPGVVGGTKPQKPATEQEQLQNYINEMRAAQGDTSKAREVMKKYKELGVPIERVTFE